MSFEWTGSLRGQCSESEKASEGRRWGTFLGLGRVGSGRVGSVWVGVRKCRAGCPEEEEEEEEKKDGSAQRISRRGNGGRHV